MVSLRHLSAALALLAVLPVAVYFGGPVVYLGLSLTCVALIAATLYLAFGPAEGGHAHSPDAR